MSDDAHRHGTFADVIRHLPRIRDMGFDVLYFPPIHPIGRINRKGRNNTLHAGPGDPGSPYAIGAAEGGHDAIHPELGTLDDFRRLRERRGAHGLELAIDFAIQCSPDHPWLAAAQGLVRLAAGRHAAIRREPAEEIRGHRQRRFLRARLRCPICGWRCATSCCSGPEQGVRTFRVDNPHTKPLPFWEWMIAEVRANHPDAIFLAEAFTRPKMMYRLAKLGFSQSYTYFTWRNTKRELTEYLDRADHRRPRASSSARNFFVNTPDINPLFLQTSGRAGFLIRAALAATLSGLWGVYSGFELCEATRAAGARGIPRLARSTRSARGTGTAPATSCAEITRLNRIRRENPALQSHLGISFLNASNDQRPLLRKGDRRPRTCCWSRSTLTRTTRRRQIRAAAVELEPAGRRPAGGRGSRSRDASFDLDAARCSASA